MFEHFEVILKQCELQRATSLEQIRGFLEAYAALCTGSFSTSSYRDYMRKSDLHALATLIEPRNHLSFRKVPVSFKDTSLGLKSELIERAMENFLFARNQRSFDNAERLYEEFERIHPYLDGNGRLGHLLWADYIRSQTGEWPLTLPPNLFNSTNL